MPMNRNEIMESLEARQLLAGDISVTIADVVSGFDRKRGVDTIEIDATIRNVGDASYRGRGQVVFFLSANETLDDSDAEFARRDLPRVANPGMSARVKFKVDEPKFVNPRPGQNPLSRGAYFVLATVTLNDENFDQNVSNDLDASSNTVAIDYQFGQVGTNSKVPLTVTLPDGVTVTFRMDGPGTGELVRDIDGRTFIVTSRTTTRSVVVVDVKDRKKTTTIGGLLTNGPIQGLRGEKVIVEGLIDVVSGISDIKIAGMRNTTITIEGFGGGVNLHLGNVVNSTVTVNSMIVQNLNVGSWLDTDAAPDFIRAPIIESIGATGNFQPGVEASFRGSDGLSLRRARIQGQLSGKWVMPFGAGVIDIGTVTAQFRASIGGTVDIFRVKGDFRGLLAAREFNKIEIIGNVAGATILAGVTLGNDTLLGGTGGDRDSVFAGRIRNLDVRGTVVNSLFAAGLNSIDGLLLNGNDVFASLSSSIDKVTLRRGMEGTRIVAPNLPQKARVGARDIVTTNDARFVRTLS